MSKLLGSLLLTGSVVALCLGAPSAQAKAFWRPTALSTRGPVTVRGFSKVTFATIPNPMKKNLVAWLVGGSLKVDRKTVAEHVGPVLWSNNGSTLFYALGPPATDPSKPEPVFAWKPGKNPVRIGVANDPWTIATFGPSGVAFDVSGSLTAARFTGDAVRTGIMLTSSGYPSRNSVFLASPNGRYVAVAGPDNGVVIDSLDKAGHVVSRQRLPGPINADRDNWGAWQGNSSSFVYNTRNTRRGTHNLYLWSARTRKVVNISSGLSHLTASGQFLVLGFLKPLPGCFLAEAESVGAPLSGTYAVIDERGRVVQALWSGGVGGTVLPSGSIRFTVSPPRGGPLVEEADLAFSH